MKKNAHIRDARVSFDPETHTYTIDGSSEGVTSATTLLGDYFPKFDPDKVVDQYYARWQQNPYKKPECYGKSKSEIKEMWRTKGEKAAQEGTRLHEAIEAFYEKKTVSYDTDSKEWKHFLEFEEQHKLIPFRTEMKLWSSDHKLGGTIDLLVKNEDGTFSLYDWKRSKDPISKNEYRPWRRNGFGPLRKLHDTKFCKYSMQLNLYRELLERYYDYDIKSMHIVRLHPSARNFQKVDVDRLEGETNALLKLREEQVKLETFPSAPTLTDAFEALSIAA